MVSLQKTYDKASAGALLGPLSVDSKPIKSEKHPGKGSASFGKAFRLCSFHFTSFGMISEASRPEFGMHAQPDLVDAQHHISLIFCC